MGFRPRRSQHHALDALYVGLLTKKVNWVLDVDIRAFFDTIDHGWLIRFLEHRLADRRVVRLIQKWLNAGVLAEDSECGWRRDAAGGSVSPLLANIYLHYVFDLWVHAWRQKCAQGSVIVVRFADDIVLGFQVSRMPSAFGRSSSNGFDASIWRCILRRLVCWNSVHTRPTTDDDVALGSPRRSISRLHAYLREEEGVMDVSRCCGRRFANGCRRSCRR